MQGTLLRSIQLFFITWLFFSNHLFADESFTIFTKYEYNDSDSASGIGVSAGVPYLNTGFRTEVVSSLNAFNVVDRLGTEQEFYSWDLGFRFGYFGDIFVYVEAGLDLFELTFENLRDDDYRSNNYNDSSNDLDGYAAIGLGFQVAQLRIEGFVKARQIDGDHWEANKTAFYGVQASFVF